MEGRVTPEQSLRLGARGGVRLHLRNKILLGYTKYRCDCHEVFQLTRKFSGPPEHSSSKDLTGESLS